MGLLVFGVVIVLAVFTLRPARLPGNQINPTGLKTPSAGGSGGVVPTAREEITVKQIQRITEISAVEDLNSMAITPDGKTAFLPSFDESQVYVLDLEKDTVRDKILLEFPFAVAIHPSQKRLYVATGVSPKLVEYNLDTLSESRRLDLPAIPYDLGVDDASGRIFISHNLENNLSVVDLDSFKIMQTIAVGETPRSLAIKDRRLYVTNFGGASVSVISTVNLSEVARIPLSGRPNRILADPTRNRLYVSDSFSNQVLVIDTNTQQLTSSISVAEFPYGLDIDSRAQNLYATGYSQNTLSIVDLEDLSLTRTIQTSPAFQAQAGFNIVKLLESQRKLYLINSLNGQVLVYAF